MNQRTIVRALRPGIFSPDIEIKIGVIDLSDNSKIGIAQPLVFEMVDTTLTTDHIPPTLRLKPDEAQQFMDELWEIGVRPTEGRGSAGQMAATERHLEDMRSLVFNPRTTP